MDTLRPTACGPLEAKERAQLQTTFLQWESPGEGQIKVLSEAQMLDLTELKSISVFRIEQTPA